MANWHKQRACRALLPILCALHSATCSVWFLSSLQLSSLGGVHNGGGGSGTGSGSGGTSTSLCDLVPGLSGRQRALCQMQPDTMRAVERGVHQAVAQCQTHFATHRWNCTTYDRAGYGSVLFKAGSREAAFVYALTSAGVVHSVARACSTGEIAGCGCAHVPNDRRVMVHNELGPFRWGGCGDNLKYASSFARRFMDANGERRRRRRRRSASSLMKRHNNRLGRKMVKRTAGMRCKCHGVSGACTTRTCWRVAAPLHTVAARLTAKYLRATQATLSADGKVSTLVAAFGPTQAEHTDDDDESEQWLLNRARRRQPNKLNKWDLVFLEPSPDYCEADFLLGSLGTAGRECSANSSAPHACDTLCCGRGYTTTTTVLVDDKCNCTFVWCCKVECRTCRRQVDVHRCNGSPSNERHTHDEHAIESNVLLRDDAAHGWHQPYRALRNYRTA